MENSVLITGGSRGIGAAAVTAFAGRGYRTAFFYRERQAEADRVAAACGALALRCDVADADAVAACAREARIYLGVPAFDSVVVNAGVSETGLFTETTPGQWDRLLDVNLRGAVHTVRAVLPEMLARKQGSIVLVSSVWGQTGASCESAYAATKAALLGLTKSLAKELGPSGIRVNAVAPGVIDTEMNQMHTDETLRELADAVPLGRLGTGAEVAEAICFLASDAAAYITGQVLAVNGGFYI